jgi:hypothetical protein
LRSADRTIVTAFLILCTKIVVGKPGDLATPLLSETMKYLTVNQARCLGKNFLDVAAALVGCGHVSGLFVRP